MLASLASEGRPPAADRGRPEPKGARPRASTPTAAMRNGVTVMARPGAELGGERLQRLQVVFGREPDRAVVPPLRVARDGGECQRLPKPEEQLAAGRCRGAGSKLASDW